MLLSVLLLAVERQSSRLDSVRALLSVLVYPIHSLVTLPMEVTDQTIQLFISYNELKKENKILQKQALLHKTDLLKLKTLEKENIRLRALMDKSYTLGEQVLAAELIGVNQAPYEHIVLVDKGTHFGVHKRQPVLDTNGVVGQVIRALPLSAEIMMITDPNHAFSVEINRNGLRTIAVGSGQYNQINLPFLPNNTDILPGDLLITSGLDGTFPRGYPVAKVNKVIQQQNKPFADISAVPIAQLDRTREVLIVWSDSKPIQLAPNSKADENIVTEEVDNPEATASDIVEDSSEPDVNTTEAGNAE